jgi:hypothetical protein
MEGELQVLLASTLRGIRAEFLGQATLSTVPKEYCEG